MKEEIFIKINNDIIDYLIEQSKDANKDKEIINIIQKYTKQDNSRLVSLADVYKIKGLLSIRGMGIFYSKIKPKKEQITAFRNNKKDKNPIADSWFFDRIELSKQKREIYLNLLDKIGEKPSILFLELRNKFIKLKYSPKEVALETRELFKNNFHIDFNKRNLELQLFAFITAVENLGALVFTYSNTHRSVDGSFLFNEVLPIIFLKNTSKARTIFTLIHELGHLLLGHNSIYDFTLLGNDDDKQEKEANAFAAEFLMPEKEIKISFNEFKEQNLSNFKKMADVFHVSLEALLIRLCFLGLINFEIKEKIIKESDSKKQGGRGLKSEFNSIINNGISPTYKLIYAKNNRKISETDYLSYFDNPFLDKNKKKQYFNDIYYNAEEILLRDML